MPVAARPAPRADCGAGPRARSIASSGEAQPRTAATAEETAFRRPEWSRRTPRFWRRVVRGLVRDAVLLAVLFGVVESAVRLFLPSYRGLLFTNELTGGHPFAVNSRGLRDREFSTVPDDVRVEVLCIGNSATWGTGVAMERTYPKRLEALLNAGAEQPLRWVINGAGQGASLESIAAYAETEGASLGPKRVVLGFSPAMIGKTILENRRPAREAGRDPQTPPAPVQVSSVARVLGDLLRRVRRVHFALYGSHAYVFWDTNVRLRLYRWGVLRDDVGKLDKSLMAYAFDSDAVDATQVEAAYEQFAGRLTALRDTLRERDIDLIVLGLPCRFELSEHAADNERGFELERVRIWPIERVAAICRRAGIPLLDARNVLREERRRMLSGEQSWDPLYIPYDYTHLNDRGHELVARRLLEFLAARSEAVSVRAGDESDPG